LPNGNVPACRSPFFLQKKEGPWVQERTHGNQGVEGSKESLMQKAG